MPQTSNANGSAIVPLDNEEKAFIEQVTKELQDKVDIYMRKQQQELEVMLRTWKTQSLQFLVEERRKLKQPQQGGRRGKQTKPQQTNQQPQQQQTQQETQQPASPSSPTQNQTEKQPAKKNQRRGGKKVKKFVEQDGEQPAEHETPNAVTPSEPAESTSATTTTTNQEKPARQKQSSQKKRAVKYVEMSGEGKIDESKIQKFTVAELEVFFYQAPNSHLKKPIQCIFTSDPATIDTLAAQLIQESDNDAICMNCFWNERFGEDVNIDAKIYLIGFTFNNKVYLFHLANCEKDLPHKVKELLERDTLYKVAPGIKIDINQLYVDWNRVWVSGILDLNIFADNSSTGSRGEETSNLRDQSTLLQTLATKVLNYQFNIPSVAKQTWSKDLLAEQLEFAAKVCWLNWKILSTKYQGQSEYKSIRSWVDGALGSYLQF